MARVTEETIIGQIRGLSPGQSYSRSQRLDLSDTDRPTTAESLQRLRNLVNQAVGRLRREDEGSNFRVESVVAVTDDKKAMLATVAVTHMGAANDDEEQDI